VLRIHLSLKRSRKSTLFDEQTVPRQFSEPVVVLATHNPGKKAELGALLSAHGIECRSAADFDLSCPDETGGTFLENAILKARHVAQATGLPALGDDSGFCVNALDGLPGIHALDWAGPEGDFSVACQRVLKMLEARRAPDRSAYYTTALALCWPDGHVEHAHGTAEGTIASTMRGSGFGYDSIFIPVGEKRTMAEIEANSSGSMAARGLFSHRAQALQALVRRCFQPQR
jgi:XTP/dITP diphosphohydrolase